MPQYVIGSASARNVCGWTARNLRRESCLSYNWRWPIAKCVFAPASMRPQSRPRCTCPCRVPHPCGEIRSVLPAQRSECTGCSMLDEAHRVAKQASQSVAQYLSPFSHNGWPLSARMHLRTAPSCPRDSKKKCKAGVLYCQLYVVSLGTICAVSSFTELHMQG